MSPGLFAQIVGRGLRLFDGWKDGELLWTPKTNCLILDFGGNIRRHGSIDDPEYGRASSKRNVSKKEQKAIEKNREDHSPVSNQLYANYAAAKDTAAMKAVIG